jgi:hypothetical protein
LPCSVLHQRHQGVKDAYVEGLLWLPDALFNSASLNTVYYQQDHPPQPWQPYFTE